MIRALALAAGLLAVAGGAWAEAPRQSPFPRANPRLLVAALPVPVPSRFDANRPASALAVAASGHPAPRPRGLKAGGVPASAPARGQLCGVPGIEGKPVAPIAGKVAGCGLAEGVKVTAVSGVKLSTPVTVDCTTAKALKKWVDKGIRPAVGNTGGGLARLEIAASYNCRPRNNQKGAKISEHGRGRAIDLAGVRLANGEVISVLQGWKGQPKILKAIHKSACGTFGTVLGPKSDRFHQDHIHVDTARYRSGAYCR
ncbi:MAG: extensin family protein [Paracoccaceae bacterium]